MKVKIRDMKESLFDIEVDSEERVHYIIQWLEAWSRDKVLMLVYKGRIIPCDSLLRDNGILDGSSILVFFKKVYPLDPEDQLLLITLMREFSDGAADKGLLILELAKEQKKARFLVQPDMINFLLLHMNRSRDVDDVRETCLKILCEIAKHECLAKEMLLATDILGGSLYGQLFLPRDDCLILSFSLLNTLLQSRESLLLVEALDNIVLDQISDIVQKSIDPILLEKAMLFGLAVFELYEEDGSTLLKNLFKMAKRALELPRRDGYTVLGAILISKVFNIQNDFAREVSTDFGFLQSMLDHLDVFIILSPGRDCILVILAHVVSHIIEEEMSEAHLYPYIKWLLKNIDVIERIVRFYQSQPPLESILWDYQELIMSWIYRMIHKWIAESSEDSDVSARDVDRLLRLAAMELH